jgi:multiple sugar transport system permease protein/raffinose/stachyose/melibiose transport system permease protein
MMSRSRGIRQAKSVAWHFVLYAITLIIISPLVWMVLSSFKPFTEVYLSPPTFLPQEPTLRNYSDLIEVTNFEVYFKNSTIVAFISTLASVVISTLGGYGLSRFRYKWSQIFGRMVLLAYVFPPILMIIPIYMLITKLRLGDTYLSLIIAYTTITIPFTLWLIKSFFDAIPRDFEEAAMVDGATPFTAFWRVSVRMVMPGIISTAVFAFVDAWNDYLYALVFISSDAKKTLPAGVQTLIGHMAIYSWGRIMAGAVMITIPAIVFFVIIQRHLVTGGGEGGVKG